MFPFEIGTVLTLLAVGHLAAVLVLMAYRSPASRKGPYRGFVGGRGFQALAWVLLALRGRIPDPVSVYLGNLLLFTGMGLEAWAFASARKPVRHLAAFLAAVTLAGTCLFAVLAGPPHRRVAVASLVSLLQYGTAAASLFASAGGSRLQKAMGFFFTLFCLSLVGRIALSLPDEGFQLMTRNGVQVLTFLSVYLLMLVGGVGFLLLAKERDDRDLKESEETFVTLFRASPDAITLTRVADGTLLAVNPGFERLSGYAARDVLGRTIRDLGVLEASTDRAALMEEIVAGRALGLEVQLRTRTGQPRTGLLSAAVTRLHGEDVVVSTLSDITERRRVELDLERTVKSLQTAMSEIKTLSGLLPICASCKKIRDDSGYWNQIETYLTAHTQAGFTHGLCPDCARLYFPEHFQKEEKTRA